jgi:hypothetical protein
MSNSIKPTISLDEGFQFNQVQPKPPIRKEDDILLEAQQQILKLNPGLAGAIATGLLANEEVSTLSSPLGDLVGFTNPVDPTQSMVFAGTGFNTIFRPQGVTKTKLPVPVPGSDNILELNLTAETLTFAAPLGNVPNRGFGDQPDRCLNGVPYVQSVNDITSGTATGIHFEPGIWLAVPPTTEPPVNEITYARMASIPHGVTINAQGISAGRTHGKPDFTNPFLMVNMNPFPIGGEQQPSAPGTRFFPSQQADTPDTARLPQDLSSFIAAKTITQEMLDNPNVVLMNEIATQNIHSFVTLIVTTDAAGALPTPPPNPPSPVVTTPPGFAGGTAEIAFLTGDANVPPLKANAHAFKMKAVFWIETVHETIVVPPCKANGLPITILAAARPGSTLRPTFTLTPPHDITHPKKLVVPFIQIQYSQTVFLNFGPLTWPHVSVATLIPGSPIVVPASAWK